jgi:hypothetical protein
MPEKKKGAQKKGAQKKPTPAPKLKVYELEMPKVGQRDIFQLAKKFKLKGNLNQGTLSEDKDGFAYKEGPFLINLDKSSGAHKFVHTGRWQTDDKVANLNLDDKTASKIAAQYIGKFKLAADKDIKFLKTAKLHVAFSDMEQKHTEHRIISVDVCFQRVIDGLPVDGPGGKIIVSIGAEKTVTGHQMLWRKVKKVSKPVKAIKPVETALAEMASELKIDRNNIEVHETRFCYFEEGKKTGQKYLQPAYIFFFGPGTQGTVNGKRTIFVAPAAVNGAGRITPVLQKTETRIRPRPDNRR